MDLKKLQKKYKITPKELAKEMKVQADEMVDLLNKEIDELGATERINNLKDLRLRNLKMMGMITEENKYDYAMVVYKSIVVQYWKERDLPIKHREIYERSFTDKGLREDQNKRQKELTRAARFANLKLKNYKQVIKEWWQQRAEEAIAEHDPGPPKGNGKAHD